MIDIKNEYYISIFLGIISVGLLYIENIINKKNIKSENYLKLFSIVIASSALSIYLSKSIGLENIKINEDILIGEPNF